IETDDDPVPTPPKRSRAETPVEPPSGGEKTSPASARAAAMRAARSKRAAAPKSTTKSGSPEAKSGSPEAPPPSDPPGEPHRWLDGLVGEWDFRLKLCLEANGTPSTSTGTAS